MKKGWKRIFGSLMLSILLLHALGCTQINETETVTDTETEASTEDNSSEAVIDENQPKLYYWEEKSARSNDVFAAFLDDEIAVNDKEQHKRMYLTDYFFSCYSVWGVHVLAKDLNDDGEDELLLCLQWTDDRGELMVFQIQEGELWKQDSLRFGNCNLNLYEDGTLGLDGTYFRFNEQGIFEQVFERYSSIKYIGGGKGKLSEYGVIQYQDGVPVNEVIYHVAEGEIDWSATSEENEDEFNLILDSFLNQLGEEEMLNHIQDQHNKDGLAYITWDEYMDGKEYSQEDLERKDEKYPVYYMVDDEVKEYEIYDSFINNEVTTYDTVLDEERYLIDYYNDFIEKPGWIYGIHFMVKDLDDDQEEELLLIVQRNSTDGDLLVFHEENGALYTWETWEDLVDMHYMEVRFYPHGEITKGGNYGDIYGRYHSDGSLEIFFEHLRIYGPNDSENHDIMSNTMTHKFFVYENGVATKEISYTGRDYRENDDWEWRVEPGDEEAEIEGNRIWNELKEELGEGESVSHMPYVRGRQIVLLEELLTSEK